MSRKPPVARAMRELIARIRAEIPFDAPLERICGDDCRSCSLKLLEFLEAELGAWEARIDDGERPGLAELSKLERTARKVHRALARNGLIDE